MINASHHYIVKFDQDWIDKAKEIRRLEDNIPGTQVFDSDHRWVGKIGEFAVEFLFLLWEPVTSHFHVASHDYLLPDKRRAEVKTKCSQYDFRENFEFDVNDQQFRKNDNDIYVACHYTLGSHEIRVVGWLPKEEVQVYGSFMKKGDLFRGKYPVTADRWSVPYREFQPIGSLMKPIRG